MTELEILSEGSHFPPTPRILTMAYCLATHLPTEASRQISHTLISNFLVFFSLKLSKTNLMLHSYLVLFSLPRRCFSLFNFLPASQLRLLRRTSFCFLSLNLKSYIESFWCLNALMVSMCFMKIDQCFLCVFKCFLELVPFAAFYIYTCYLSP